MKKTNTKSLLISLCFAVAAFVLLLTFVASPVTSAKADTTATFVSNYSQKITVNVIDDQGNNRTPNSSESVILHDPSNNITPDYARQTFNWSNVKYFGLAFDTENTQPGENGYNYTYTVSWTPQLVTAEGHVRFDAAHAVHKEIYNGENETTIKPLNFLIDNNTLATGNNVTAGDILGETYQTHGGWGLYIFSLQYNNDVMTSAVYELLPTEVTDQSQAPVLSFTTQGSDHDIRSAYLFQIDDEYKFVNRDHIVWSVNGRGKDGKSYVLTPSDIVGNESSAMPDNAVLRTGPTFKFDPPIQGTWTVTCTVYADDDHTVIAQKVTSDQISTITGVSESTIIWIIVGCVAAVIVIVAIIIAFTIKREKVY